jgi:hypothetical protein
MHLARLRQEFAGSRPDWFRQNVDPSENPPPSSDPRFEPSYTKFISVMLRSSGPVAQSLSRIVDTTYEGPLAKVTCLGARDPEVPSPLARVPSWVLGVACKASIESVKSDPDKLLGIFGSIFVEYSL